MSEKLSHNFTRMARAVYAAVRESQAVFEDEDWAAMTPKERMALMTGAAAFWTAGAGAATALLPASEIPQILEQTHKMSAGFLQFIMTQCAHGASPEDLDFNVHTDDDLSDVPSDVQARVLGDLLRQGQKPGDA